MQSLQLQLRVIHTMLKREIDINLGGSSLNFVAAMLEPVLLVLIVTAWHYSIRVSPPIGTSIMLFVVTGLYPMYIFVHLSSSFRGSVRSGARSRLYPIERALDAIIAKGLLTLIMHLLLGLSMFTFVYVWATRDAIPWNPLLVLESMSAMVMLGFGIGMCVAVLENLWPLFSYIWAPFSRSMILTSGVLLIPDFTFDFLRKIVVWSPLMHAVSLFRQGFYPQYPKVLYSPGYMWAWAFGSLVLGLIIERIYHRKLDKT